jgi:orotidine-5'-phosphate decarboxylase
MKTLLPEKRLIVAADFKPKAPDGRRRVWNQVIALAGRLKGTGVYLKVNSALRACGYDLLGEIHSRGLRVFADLKLYDIGETLSTDGVLLCEAQPELLTVVCSSGVSAIQMLKAQLPNTEVLGVTVLTNFNEDDSLGIYDCVTSVAVNRLSRLTLGVVDGFICAGKEAEAVRRIVGPDKTINTPAIRPTWAIVLGEDQNPERIMTPTKAIRAGADRIVVGRPITQSDDPYGAVMRTIEEIAEAVA